MKKESLEALGAVEILTEETVPTVVHKGVYTLWRKPDGTLRIQYHRDDKEDEDFFEMPGAMVAMAEKLAKGEMNPMDMIKEVGKIMMMRPQ